MAGYSNPTPVVVLLIRTISETARLQYVTHVRGIPPEEGGTAFLSGYVNEGESAEEAAARECLEEIGMATDPSMWNPVLTRTTPSNRMLIFMRLDDVALPEYVLEKFVPNEEVREVSFASQGSKLCFPIHQEILDQLFAPPRPVSLGATPVRRYDSGRPHATAPYSES